MKKVECRQQTVNSNKKSGNTAGKGWAVARQTLMLFTAFALLSCTSFLEEDNKSSLTEEQAYGSLEALKNNAVLAIYNYIGGNAPAQGLQGTSFCLYDFNTFTTDEAIMPTRGSDWYDGGFWQRLCRHEWGNGIAYEKDVWDYLFKVIMQCNYYIERVKTFQVTHTDTVLENYVAELRAVRALFYFYAMDLFGRIPIVVNTTATTSELTLSKRSEVFRYIVNELQSVYPLLSSAHSNQKGDYYGRVTKPVVCFLLAKLALNAEIYTYDNWTNGYENRPKGKNIFFTVDGQKLNAWQTCIVYCDSLIEQDYYLEYDYTLNFNTTNERSRENIFTIPMNPTIYNNQYCYFYRSRHYSHGAALGGASENGTSAALATLETFHYKKDDEDPRFALTWYADTVKENGKVVYEDDGKTPLIYYPEEVRMDLTGSVYEKTAGARLHKYPNDPDANADGRACNNDIVLFRYADATLMKAEALLRLGLFADNQLNEVRIRVGAPNREATLETIYAERELELSQEGWRRNDMIRFGTFTKEYPEHTPSSIDLSGASIVFPIPSDLMIMHPTWEQNPGY